MIQDIAPKKYVNHYEEQSPTAEDWMLVYGTAKCSAGLTMRKFIFQK